MKRLLCLMLALLCALGVSACSLFEENTLADTTAESKTVNVTEGIDAPSEEKDPSIVAMQYDDRYVFEEIVSRVETVNVTSEQVGTNTPDHAVLKISVEDPRVVIAVGVGTARVILKNGETVSVTVSPAPLRMLFLLGQSNAEGMTIGTDEAVAAEARSKSVVCKEGSVYSTYAPGEAKYGDLIGGVDFSNDLTVSNAKNFVAMSLTSELNLKGEELEYPLNQLTANGRGKAGLDSSIAYAWHKETGEKVWVINAAHSGSDIFSWQPDSAGNNNFWQAIAVLKNCISVMEDEVASGHYTYCGMGYFWLQGCADRSMSSARYTELYMSMHNGLEQELSTKLTAVGKDAVDFGGIILVRESTGALTVLDVKLNGPRTAQIYMGTTTEAPYENIYLASALGDRFVTDRGVERYFKEKYPDGKLNYPTRTDYPLPITAAATHPDIHYRQPGYNALGYDAASNVISALKGDFQENASIRVLRPNGFEAYRNGETITLKAGENLLLAALTEDFTMCTKGIIFETNMDGVSISCNTLTVAGSASVGSEGVLAVYLGGQCVMQFKICVQ